MESTYIAGETITYSLDDANYSTAELKVGANSYALTKSGSAWTATIDSSEMSGQYRFAAIADGRVRDCGKFYVKTLVSKYRAIVKAIDKTLEESAAGGVSSFSVEGLETQYKTFAELSKARTYYERLAKMEEEGSVALEAPKRISEVYA